MTTSQFFVYRRAVAWTAMFATLLWGVYAYLAMPQRQDPIVPVRTSVIVTSYPGASAEKVEQEVTRKIEKKVSENPSVEHVRSLNRQGLSVIYVDLFDTIKDTESVWMELRGKLNEIGGLPVVGQTTVRPLLNNDFGETVAVMLTISSPPVTDLEIELRARSIRSAVQAYRETLPVEVRSRHWTGVLVYPNTVARSYVLRIGRTLAQRLREAGVVDSTHIIEAPGAGMLDIGIIPGKTLADVRTIAHQWGQESMASGESNPDIWMEFWIQDLVNLEKELRLHARDKYTYRELYEFANRILDRLNQSPYIAKIDLIGVQDEQISLFYSGQRFNQFGITPQSVVSRLQQRNINLPGGQVELPNQKVVVHPTGEFASQDEIGNVVMAVSQEGYPLYLRDLVEVMRGYVDPSNTLNFRTVKVDRSHPKTGKLPSEQTELQAGHEETSVVPEHYGLQTTRAITLAVRQIKGTKVSDFAKDLQQALDSLREILPNDLQIERTSNEPLEVSHKIEEFERNLIEAILIVVFISLVFMEWRSALLVAFSIPITVAMTLGLCQFAGVDLQQVSIAALIIALGLLVDDPVVAADAINREIAYGKPRHIAAWLGPQKLAHAILFATLTNIVAFLPLLLITGKVGSFIWSLPVVVTASLVSSRVVSMTFMPTLGYYVLRGQKELEADSSGRGGSRFAHGYKAFVEWCIAHRLFVLFIAICLLSVGLCLATLIGTMFFPKDLHNVFVVNIYTPEGTPIRQSRDIALRTIQKIDDLEGKSIHAYTTFVGAGGPRFWLSVTPEQRADNYAQILVHSTSKHETADIVLRLKRDLPPQIADANVTIEQLETGPPVGVPVQIRVYGSEIKILRELGAQIKDRLRSIPGTDNIHDDWGDEIMQISLKIDPDKASITGLTNQDIAAAVASGLSGYRVTSLREEDRLVDIVLRLRPSERSQINDLFDLYAQSMTSNVSVPLRQIASFERHSVSPKIYRRDHERCMTILCDALPGVLPSSIVKTIRGSLPSDSHSEGVILFPPGYHWEFGGEQYEQAKGFRAVAVALIVSLIAIYLALVLQFNSVTKPILVYAAVPFGMVGGLMGLLVFDAPFGFMAFLGVASLAGVIISHVIVLFDFVEEMHRKGEPLRRAVVNAGLARLRPVLVTVLATAGGLIPLAIEGGPLWEPMCYVQIAGLLVATLVTLVLVPVLYVLFVENLKLVRWDKAPEDELPADIDACVKSV